MLLTATRINKHADFTLRTNDKLHVKHAYSQAAALTKPLLDILRGFRGSRSPSCSAASSSLGVGH